MNRTTFFNAVRQEPFGGSMSQSQVDGLTRLLATNDAAHYVSTSQLAYVLATVFHETARTMQPVEEVGKGRGHVYGLPDPVTRKVYYGRGYVQLTWRKNYEAMGKRLGIDLVDHPELALDPSNAAAILFIGMRDGMFTGRKLSDYVNDDKTDYLNARQIINRMDEAQHIATYAHAFAVALT